MPGGGSLIYVNLSNSNKFVKRPTHHESSPRNVVSENTFSQEMSIRYAIKRLLASTSRRKVDRFDDVHNNIGQI